MVYLVLKTSQLNPLSYLNNSVSVNAKDGKSSYIPKDLIIRKRAFICYYIVRWKSHWTSLLCLKIELQIRYLLEGVILMESLNR